MGSDTVHTIDLFNGVCISIHAPRVGSDVGRFVDVPESKVIFQSTLPVWGATHKPKSSTSCESYFNPRSPCGERQKTYFDDVDKVTISIHAPRVGSDCTQQWHLCSLQDFNPRSPCGERPKAFNEMSRAQDISIHAPRVGSDVCKFGEDYALSTFQSTLPVWGATSIKVVDGEPKLVISIHAPRVGSDNAM